MNEEAVFSYAAKNIFTLETAAVQQAEKLDDYGHEKLFVYRLRHGGCQGIINDLQTEDRQRSINAVRMTPTYL